MKDNVLKTNERTQAIKIRAKILSISYLKQLKNEKSFTFKELCQELEIKSVATVQHHLNKLCEEGLFLCSGGYRGYSLSPTGKICVEYMEAALSKESLLEKILGLSVITRTRMQEIKSKADEIDSWRLNSNRHELRRINPKNGEREPERKVSNVDIVNVISRVHTYEEAAQELKISRRSLRERIAKIIGENTDNALEENVNENC